MLKKIKRFWKSRKGFSLVELIVTITIMAILIAILAPSLIGYIEDSHAKKDNTNMEGVVRAVETALADYDIYKAVLRYSTEVPAKYEDSKKGEAGEFSTTEKISKGITITFYSDEKDNPKEAKLSIDNAIVNAGINATKGSLQVGDVPLTDITVGSTETLYDRIVQTVGETITLDSETYKNSNYTIFIELGEETSSAHVYGQWNGTELFESVGNGSNSENNNNNNTSGDNTIIPDVEGTLSGTYYFNEILPTPPTSICNTIDDNYNTVPAVAISVTINNIHGEITGDDGLWGSDALYFGNTRIYCNWELLYTEITESYYKSAFIGWEDEAYRTWSFGESQTVSIEVWEFVTSNATKIAN